MEHTLQDLVFKIKTIYQENGGDLGNSILKRQARQKVLNYFLEEFDQDLEGFKKDLRLLYLENYLQHWLDDEIASQEFDEEIELEEEDDEDKVSKEEVLKEFLEDIKVYLALPTEKFKDTLLKDNVLEDFIDDILIAYEDWDIEYYDYTNLELSLKDATIKKLILELHPNLFLEGKHMQEFAGDTKICEQFRDYEFMNPCEYLLSFICVYPLVHDHKRFSEYVGIKLDEIAQENKKFYRQVLSILLQYFYQRKIWEIKRIETCFYLKNIDRANQEEEGEILQEIEKSTDLDGILEANKMYVYHYALFNNLLLYRPSLCDSYFQDLEKEDLEVLRKLKF